MMTTPGCSLASKRCTSARVVSNVVKRTSPLSGSWTQATLLYLPRSMARMVVAGREDDWPLAAPPDVSTAHLIVRIVPSRLWDVWPVLGEFAKAHELVMYDPQQPVRLS